MEQLNNNAALSMLQTIAAQSQSQMTKTGKSDTDGEFQKLLDQKTKSNAKSDAPAEESPKTGAASTQKEDAPVQKEEDPLEQVKKLAEQGYAAAQPNVGTIPFDASNAVLGQTETGEYVVMQLSDDGVSIIELDPWQQQQIQQFMHNTEVMDQAKDPEVDAMLEATDPAVEHSPVELLEQAVDGQFGKAAEQIVDAAAEGSPIETGRPEEVLPVQGEDDAEVELVGTEQAPQRLFHDVEAAPVKVGDVYEAPKDEPNVARQVDMGLAQAMEKGESLVRIQLNPESLGEVTVEISRSAEGIIHVALNAHSGETRSLLERHAGELQNLVAGRTQQEVEVNVQRQQESQQGQNHNYDGRSGRGQNGQEQQHRQQRQQQTDSQDFIQQLRLGLIPADGE